MSIACLSMTFLVFVLLLSSISLHAQQLDQFGGAVDKKCALGPRPHWYTEKIQGHWWFCTPDGNAFYMQSVWNATTPGGTPGAQKLGGTLSSAQTRMPVLVRRLKNWGFNALDFYSSRYGSPTANSHLQPEYSVPVIMGESIRPSYYGLSNANNLIAQPLKAFDVMTWINGQRSGAWRLQDIFDAQYKAYLTGLLKNTSNNTVNHVFTATPEKQKWVIGWSVDDTDWLSGFGAGPDFVTSVDGAASTSNFKRHQHAGLMALYTSPVQGASARAPVADSGIIYQDPRKVKINCNGAEDPVDAMSVTARPADVICTKYALQKFLQAKYGTIAALNAAWGSKYTTFGSSGSTVKNHLVATTNGSNTVTATIPNISATRQITPFSLRVYVNGVYVAADARYFTDWAFTCAVAPGSTSGYVWGPSLQGSFATNNCPNPINYATGAITLKFDTAPPAGQQIRLDYTINGWGRGKGLMDEAGKSPWLVNIDLRGTDSFLLSTIDQDIKADLDTFLYRYAYRYFKDVRDAIDELTPGCNRSIPGTCFLYTGPSYLGTWGSPAYRQVIQAAAEIVDVYPYYTLPDYLPDYQERVNFLYQYWGDKPIISWEGFTGGNDSPFPADGGNQVRPRDNTQADRGAQYKRMTNAMLQMQYPNGSYPGIGIRYWDMQGSSSEVMNWGFLTPNDDPLDGFCPGPGTRFETVPGGSPISQISVSGSTATVTTSFFHSVNVGARVKISGATGDIDLNGEYPVQSINSTSFTLAVANVYGGTYNESTLKIDYVRYPCGGSTAVCMSCTTGPNRYLTTDPRFVSDPDGPHNNIFGDFLSHVRAANAYWLDIVTKP
jgi:hypothetical protein